jgi:hypothetical protein
MLFRLRFSLEDIPKWTERFSIEIEPEELPIDTEIAPKVRERGYYTKPEFLKVCRWKSPRTKPLCAANPASRIEIVSRAALSSNNERARIETFTLLSGVSWPTASVLLHFGHSDPYPILDFRALWSLGVSPPPPYTFAVWWEYVQFCRDLAKQAGVTVRDLDRALWQYSAVHQRAG